MAKIDPPKPAEHTIYFGPTNMHGTVLKGVVVAHKGADSHHPEARYLFQDSDTGRKHWVKESSVRLI